MNPPHTAGTNGVLATLPPDSERQVQDLVEAYLAALDAGAEPDLAVLMDKHLPVVREVRDDGTYLAVRVGPEALLAGTPAPVAGERKVAVIVDTSRSSLESRALELELLRTTLGELGPHDRFAILASDVAVTPQGPAVVSLK